MMKPIKSTVEQVTAKRTHEGPRHYKSSSRLCRTCIFENVYDFLNKLQGGEAGKTFKRPPLISENFSCRIERMSKLFKVSRKNINTKKLQDKYSGYKSRIWNGRKFSLNTRPITENCHVMVIEGKLNTPIDASINGDAAISENRGSKVTSLMSSHRALEQSGSYNCYLKLRKDVDDSNRKLHQEKQNTNDIAVVSTSNSNISNVDIKAAKFSSSPALSPTKAISRFRYQLQPPHESFVALTPLVVLRNSNQLISFNSTLRRLYDPALPKKSQLTANPRVTGPMSLSMTEAEFTKEEVVPSACKKEVASDFQATPTPAASVDLIFCEGCLTILKTSTGLSKHRLNCRRKNKDHPGNCVYKKDNVKIYEVDGSNADDGDNDNHFYCFNLSNLSKQYVNSLHGKKHVTFFLYYVLYVSGHFAGYFSKDKYVHWKIHNMAVLLVLPRYRKLGFGKLLVSFSYEISKIEKIVGTPERPLSDSASSCYLSYWMESIVRYIATRDITDMTIESLSAATHIHVNDLILALEKFCMIYKTGDNSILKIPQQVYNRFLKFDQASSGAATRNNLKLDFKASASRNVKKYNLDLDCVSYVASGERKKDQSN